VTAVPVDERRNATGNHHHPLDLTWLVDAAFFIRYFHSNSSETEKYGLPAKHTSVI
jgi:hypothetical protein